MINIILAVFSTYLIFRYYGILFHKKDNSIINRIVLCLYWIWQLLSYQFLKDIPIWFCLMINILFALIVCLCFRGEVLGKAVFAVLYHSVWMLSEVLTDAVFLMVGLSLEKYRTLASVFSKLLLLVLVKLLQKLFHRNWVNVLTWKENIMLMLMPIGSMFVTYHLFTLSHKTVMGIDRINLLIAFILLFLMNVVLFVVYIKFSGNLEVERKNSILQFQLNLCNEYIKEKEDAMLEFRKLKHDFKHQLFFLSALLKDKKYDEVETYIEGLLHLKSLDGFTIVHSDNPLIDALVNEKYERAKQYGIHFHTKLDIPVSFPLANADLCIILGNALDNAIEANIGADISNPYIDLKMKYDRNNLIIILENSFDGCIQRDGKGHIITKKQDKHNHGIGLTSIQNALVQYHGLMKTEMEDKVYKLTIVMYDNKE